MIKDVLLRFLSIMLFISLVLITHMTWDVYNSKESGMQFSEVYKADVNTFGYAVSFMLLSWLVFAIAIIETLRSAKVIKPKPLSSRYFDYERASNRPDDRPSIGESWIKEDNRYVP